MMVTGSKLSAKRKAQFKANYETAFRGSDLIHTASIEVDDIDVTADDADTKAIDEEVETDAEED